MPQVIEDVVLHGMAGCGKDTQLEMALKLLGANLAVGMSMSNHIDAEIARKPRAYAELKKKKVGGVLVPDFVVNGLFEDWYCSQSSFIRRFSCGTCRSVEQAMFLQDLALEHGHRPVHILINFTEDAGLERVKLRGREDDEEKTYRRRCQAFRVYFPQVEEYLRSRTEHFFEVDGHGTPDQVFAQIEPYLHAGVLT